MKDIQQISLKVAAQKHSGVKGKGCKNDNAVLHGLVSMFFIFLERLEFYIGREKFFFNN